MTYEKPFKRTDRVAQQILEILGDTVIKHIDLSYLGFVTFTHALISPDLRYCKIFYSVVNPKMSSTEIDLEINNKSKAFRKFLGQNIKIKNTPEIAFVFDDSIQYEEHMFKILKDLQTGNS